MKTCQDVMTANPVCCLPTDYVNGVAEIMKTENVGSLPVVANQDSRKLIGILTDRDLALKVVSKGLDPKTTKVEEVMTRKVITCRIDDGLQLALNAMSENQLRRIVIVDQANIVLGIISQADIATKGNQPEKTAELVKDVSESSK